MTGLDALSGPDGTQALRAPRVFPDAVGGSLDASTLIGGRHHRVSVPAVAPPPAPRAEFVTETPSWVGGATRPRAAAGLGARHVAASSGRAGGEAAVRVRRSAVGPGDQALGWMVLSAVAAGMILLIFLLIFLG
ncbi:hypothetical protein FHR81_005435 [Actinoalloteichus hoggarensis]|uniref:Uncharacterized protein n=1 Tax=Actinoalloteichus hoggarensis TaxID=1470176 RepID=A0A221VWL9_9PSEU|nr:hypothetical protein [Actinoalloteichus hoggarensis]ASO17946.1 hypothetical protein AHOG_01400 [Actinoalloteichus hoggarensis]MBB5924358.1 hypothetical protein [Actinoalloteichus hoggarensis]